MSLFDGVIPAMVTPFTSEGEVAVPILRNLTLYLLDHAVHGLFATGSQGEFWALSADEKQLVWETVVEGVDGRVPVYAGTAAISTHETIALTKRAEQAKVDAVSILTPFYVTPTEQELYNHYRAVAEATSLPMLLYSNPGRTGGVRISPNLAARLSEIENIVGIKDSSGDLQATAEYIRATPPDFAVLIGRDSLILAGLIYGARGAIAATGNVAPGLVASIYERFRAHDIDGARQAQELLMPLRQAFSWGTFPVVVKEALNIMGMEAGPTRGPVDAMTEENREHLAGVLRELNLLQTDNQ